MKPEQQTKMFSTAEYNGLQVRKNPKNNIPTWQWLQNTKVLKIWILIIEKDKISFIQYLRWYVTMLKFYNTLELYNYTYTYWKWELFQNYGNTIIINAEMIDTIIPRYFFLLWNPAFLCLSLSEGYKNISAYISKGEHHIANDMTF